MKFAFVVPRYGKEIVGGAELGARMMAERLVERLGWSVEVFTTCAKDHVTWANEFPEGTEAVNGVTVHRFATSRGRPARFFPFSERVLSYPEAATIAEAEEFVELQGPGCQSLVEALAASDRDLFAFYPYLYTTTVRGLPAVADRALIHPAAHDEPALHLGVFRSPMTQARGLVYHTRAERVLVERLFPVAAVPQLVAGLGFDTAPEATDVAAGRDDPAGIGDRPYLLYVGRVDGFKGTTMLGAYFAAYKDRHPGPLALVIAGPVTAQPPAHRDVVVTGPVTDADKWELMRGATAFIHPSPHESFSIVLMEAWSCGLPVVVNARCDATREHVESSGGGMSFGSYAQLEVVLDRIAGDPGLRRLLGERGKTFVEANFRWPTIIDRYGRFAEHVLRRGPVRV
ncbi:MAG: glycosyltransferase family 4 protein [Acidimicrobiales bacterium]